MALAITIGAIFLISVLGILGLWRGVQRGLLTLGGTLLGALLVDLWSDNWSVWVRDQLKPEIPSTSVWLVATSSFVAVALIIGYGSGSLVPTAAPSADGKKVRQHPLTRPLGALLGVLNGALIVGYLLHYANELLQDRATTVIQASLVTRTLFSWLPWFILAVVLSMSTLVLIRMLVGALRFMTTRPAPPSKPIVPATAPAAGAAPASVSNAQVANAPNQAGKLNAVNNKIDQALGDQRK